MATSSLRSKFEEHLTCSVCLEKLKDPKVLPCLHSFCHDCIVKLARNAKSKNIICPECRKVVQIDDPNNLSNLPSNFFVNNLLATMALTDDQEAKKIVCGNCDSGDVAETHCEECRIFLCHFCTESHKRYRATKDHGLASMHELKVSAGPASVAEKLRCTKHKDEVITLYCKTCQATICRDCTIVDHQGHEYNFIEDVALQERQKLQTNLNEVNQRKVKVEQGIASLLKFDEALVTKKESVIAGINQHFDELAKVMEIRRRKLVHKATTLTSSKQKQIHSQIEQLEMALACCESSIKFTEQAFKNGNNAQVMSMQKYILQSLEDLKKDQTQPCVTGEMTLSIPSSVKEIKENLFNSYAVDDVVASPENCQASFDEPDPVLKIGKQSTITISCYDKKGKRVNHGGQLIEPTISGVEFTGVTVNDNKDGTHKVTFCLRHRGVFKFQVSINGHPAQRCFLTKDVKCMISNAYGSGEITEGGFSMTGSGWRVGDCLFESGVHTWKVRSKFQPNVYSRANVYSVEVGVTDINASDLTVEKVVYSFSLIPPLGSIDLTLVLDMKKKSLKCTSNYHGIFGVCLESQTQNKSISAVVEKFSPYFFCPSRCTLSIIE